MAKFVALFRGINVGKAKRIAMADLRKLLERMDYTGVATLLNSGNAVFDAKTGKELQHAKRIREAVATELGVDALVIVKSAKDIAGAIEGNVLADVATDPSRLLVAFTDAPKALEGLTSLAGADWGKEKLHIGKHAAYLWCADGILESKAAVALLKGLDQAGTTRNWARLEKIHALMQSA